LVFVTGGGIVRNVVAQTLLGAFDVNDGRCRRANTAVGASCPAGCLPRPAVSSESRAQPTECRSALWIATCGKACAPKPGFARLSDGRLVDGRRLTLVLRDAPNEAMTSELAKIGVSLSPRFDRLDSFDAILSSGSVENAKKRLSALPQVVSADFVLR
jgi:hypothetical protein